jgi:6-phosphogluconolactonase (cycloisomerase 2 family)
MAFSPDGRLLAALRPDGDRGLVAILHVDAETGRMYPVAGSPFSVGEFTTSVAFSPNGRFLAFGWNGIDYTHESVQIFSAPPECSDPDHDRDCD